jgi:hypothetical protein
MNKILVKPSAENETVQPTEPRLAKLTTLSPDNPAKKPIPKVDRELPLFYTAPIFKPRKHEFVG